MTTAAPTIQTYTIVCRHPSKDLGYDIETIATSASAAVSRARGTLFHKDRDPEWLDGTFEVVAILPGVQYSDRAGVEL